MNTKSAAHEMDDAGRRTACGAESALDTRRRRWRALLDRIAGGDLEALGALYDDSSSLTFGLIVHILQDTKAAEDALVGLYRQIRAEAYANIPDAVSWLLGLARRSALARLQHERPGRIPPSFAPLPSAATTTVTPFEPLHRERQRVRRALDQLTPRQRSIIQMTYFGGLSGADVADELKVPTQQVMGEIRQAMSTLRCSLACADAD